MKIRKISYFICSIAAFGLIQTQAQAASLPADLSVGGGIAMPSALTAAHTNPAGLVENRNFSVSLQGGSDHPWEDPKYRGQLSLGNGTYGITAGLEYQNLKDPADDVSSAYYGLGLRLAPLGLTLGVSGRTGVKVASGTDYDAGLFFEPTRMLRFAATAKGIKNEVDEYGAGLALELTQGVALVVDAAFDRDLKENELKPGLYLGNRFAGVSVSYGTGDALQFKDELSAGLYLRVASMANLELLYRAGGRFPDYYGALTFEF